MYVIVNAKTGKIETEVALLRNAREIVRACEPGLYTIHLKADFKG